MAIDSISGNSKRITGMFSGLDTDQMVKDMTATQQGKVDNKYRDKQLNEWKSEALESVNDLVSDFSNKYCSVLGTDSMLKAATYSQYKITTLASSNAVTISASDGAFEGKYSVSVSQLAGAATAAGTKGISASGSLSASNNTKLKDLDFGTPLEFDQNGNISFEINGKAFTFSKDDTLQTMVNTINNDEDANVTMKYSRLTDSFTIESDDMGAGGSVSIRNISGNAFGTYGVNTPASVTGSALTVGEVIGNGEAKAVTNMTLQELADASGTDLVLNSSGKVYFQVNGRGYAFDPSRTVQEVMDTLNASKADVSVTFDEEKSAFSITSTAPGADSAVDVQSDGFAVFGISMGTYTEGAGAPKFGAFGIGNGTFTDGAQDAIVTINGTTITRKTNEFTVDGVTYNLNDVTENTEHFNVERDYSSTVDAVKEFVNGINELLDGLEAMIEVKDQSKEYKPLTDAEKAEMTEEQIKLWEEKSKGGILYRDDDIQKLIANIKNSIYSAVGGTGMNLSAIG
ncbi:MAG: flagellar filament capping protein FliD, partial [Oscillospiraceae bacterium]|nr:flagellar filament capping protein FliD [Oscillospiraceae bacterium]